MQKSSNFIFNRKILNYLLGKKKERKKERILNLIPAGILYTAYSTYYVRWNIWIPFTLKVNKRPLFFNDHFLRKICIYNIWFMAISKDFQEKFFKILIITNSTF